MNNPLELAKTNTHDTKNCTCRTCGGDNTQLLGKLPSAREFAGQKTSAPLPGGCLWRCRTCGFVFRAPLLPDPTYESLYTSGSLDLWDSESVAREDFRLITEMMIEFSGRSIKVLDVGCYTGNLLKTLPGSFQLFGIEPNQRAAKVAAERGITMLSSLDEVRPGQDEFDVIILCDVIEHVAKPKELLKTLRQHLKRGGWLILSTGDSNAWLWRLTKARFWYCHFPEHISFLGKRWLRTVPATMQYKLQRLLTFNYRGNGTNIVKMCAALVFWLNPGVYQIVRRATSKSHVPKPTPGIGATRDHLICVLEAI